jgi:hypothetical protein
MIAAQALKSTIKKFSAKREVTEIVLWKGINQGDFYDLNRKIQSSSKGKKF